MVVEDNAVLRLLATRLLEQEGCRVEAFATAAAACSRLSRPERLDAALLDLELGDGSGLELARQARRIRPGLPLIAVSAHGDAGMAARVREAGFSACLVKPYGRAELVRTLRDCLGPSEQPGGG